MRRLWLMWLKLWNGGERTPYDGTFTERRLTILMAMASVFGSLLPWVLRTFLR